jgi:hypothetical protein
METINQDGNLVDFSGKNNVGSFSGMTYINSVTGALL